jgi:hypothetical protein
MTDHLENLILSEAKRLGFQPNAEAMRQAAIDLAGSILTDHSMIHMPGVGSIAPADFVRDLRSRMPNSFASRAHEYETETTGNLTDAMRQEVAASRRQRALPTDWLALRSKATGITAEHMLERERSWK